MASVIVGLPRNFYTRTHVNFTHVNKRGHVWTVKRERES